MTLSYTSDLAQQALQTTTALLQVQSALNDAETARVHDALSSIRETLSRLVKNLQYPLGEALLDSHTFLLERYISFLDANFVALQGGTLEECGSPTRFLRAIMARRQNQTRTHILRFLENLVIDLAHHTELLEIPQRIEPLQHCPQQHDRRSGDIESRGRSSRQVDNRDKYREPKMVELEGDHFQRAEMPASPVMANIQRRSSQNLAHSSSPGPTSQIEQTDGHYQVDPPPTPMTPPPPYRSDVVKTNAEDSSESDLVLHPINTDAYRWHDPITQSCRQIIAQRFPTPSPSFFDDYAAYRQQVRDHPGYRWYLNFRYLSFILQPEIPSEVFLVEFEVKYSLQRSGMRISHTLLYSFEDCLVFGRSPFLEKVPDPRLDPGRHPDDLPLMLESGIEVLEEFSVRFEHLRRIDRQEEKVLTVYAEGRTMRLRFRHTCQCSRVFHGMRKYLLSIDEDQARTETARSASRRSGTFRYNHESLVDVGAPCSRAARRYHRHSRCGGMSPDKWHRDFCIRGCMDDHSCYRREGYLI